MSVATVNADLAYRIETYARLSPIQVMQKHRTNLQSGYKAEKLSEATWYVYKSGEATPYTIKCNSFGLPESCNCEWAISQERTGSAHIGRPWACKHMFLVLCHVAAAVMPQWAALSDIVAEVEETYTRREARRNSVQCRSCPERVTWPQSICGACKAELIARTERINAELFG